MNPSNNNKKNNEAVHITVLVVYPDDTALLPFYFCEGNYNSAHFRIYLLNKYKRYD